MKKEIQLSFSPENALEKEKFLIFISKALHLEPSRIKHFELKKKSLDARSNQIVFHHLFEVYIDEQPKELENYWKFKEINNKNKVIIVGAGPSGLFAALTLLKFGIKPIILERGKKVEDRKFDIANLQRNNLVNPNSNYCFGEGGAGTYSDGKLYTRSNKRGNIYDVLSLLIKHGADESIRYESHAHIGTDKLPVIIANIRETIIEHGGEIYFSSFVTNLIIKNKTIVGVNDINGKEFIGDSVILATGHSARDFYQILHQSGVILEPKPFAVGVRIEHPQELINELQYKKHAKSPYLPAATYSFVNQVNGRGVFSFCMCPGGIIVPSATANNQVVVNGMSNSRRNSPFANAGMVVSISPQDISKNPNDIFAGINFQEKLENDAFLFGGKTQTAPAQRMLDFVNGVSSKSIAKTSYHPGICSAEINKILPQIIVKSLQQAFKSFGNSKKGFLTNEANILMVESRTSSPIRIPRNPETLEHTAIQRLFPAGEGAGYAGGIVSSAIDGINIATKISQNLIK